MTRDDESPGWDAITARLAEFYGDQEPKHSAPVLPAMLGGTDPLDGISIYKSGQGHLHYVSYGFTELYDKDSDDAGISGFGFELTLRLADGDLDDPPTWPLSLMNNLARYVFQTGSAFDENHHLPCNSRIALDTSTDLTCLMFQLDPELGEIDTPNGSMKFLQLVALTDDEYELIKAGYYPAVRDRVNALDPMMVIHLDRKSILTDRVRAEIEAMEPEVNQVESFGTHVEFEIEGDAATITIGATRVDQLVTMLNEVLSSEQPIFVYGKRVAVGIRMADDCAFKEEDGLLSLTLSPDAAAELAGVLEPIQAVHRLDSFAELTVEVVPVEIKDQDGNVVSTVGK